MVDERPMPKTEEEWKKLLTPEQYCVLRTKGAGAPGSADYLHEKKGEPPPLVVEPALEQLSLPIGQQWAGFRHVHRSPGLAGGNGFDDHITAVALLWSLLP
jgi:hypothetical protein